MRRGSAGSIARFGSLSWFDSPLKMLGIMLTTKLMAASSAWRRSPPAAHRISVTSSALSAGCTSNR